MPVIRSIRVLVLLILLCSALISTGHCQQILPSDPNRDMNSVYYTTGNPYYNAGYSGQCTWYVWGRCKEIGWDIGYTLDANGYYKNVKGESGEDLTPQVGDIMCLPVLDPIHGHVSIVVQVNVNNNPNSLLVDEYNVRSLQWDRETVTRDPNNSTRVMGQLFGWTTLQGFIHSPNGGGSVDPTNLYVDGSYNGTQIGNASNPFKTVVQAINAASATQATIHIKSGTYGEKVGTTKHILFVTWGTGTVRIGG